MRLAALAIAGVMILTTEKLDVVVVLVEVEIEVAAALRAFQQAGKYAGLLRDRGLFAARPFLERLHLFPSLAVNNGLMDIEEDRPVLFRVLNPLFHLVGLGVAFEVNDIAAVFLQGEDLLDGGVSPFGRLHGAFRPAPARPAAAPVIGGIDHAIGGELHRRFCQPVPLQRHVVNPAHDLGSLRLYHPKAGIVWVFDVTVGRRRKRNTCISFHLVYDPALLGNVFRIILVHNIFEWGEIVLAFIAVYAIGNSHQPYIVKREKFFRQFADLNVVAPQPGQVFDKHRRDIPGFDCGQHFLKTGTLHGRSSDAIIYKENRVGVPSVLGGLLEYLPLIKDRILFSEGALKVQTLGGTEYPIKYLSSGEKSIFYFLACIFLKEKKSYYFVDEPENNLNPSIVSKLWDIIEKHREGSIFVYLTHDSNFVASRINSKLFWIEKYDGTEWVYKPLPENDNLPQHLMVALVGNREPVLFCESQDEYKYDDIVFKMMFPEFKVIPAAGCDAVIAKVKAYSIAGLPQKAFGIIDCDYKDQSYLEGQETDGIFHLPFFEIENFLFSEEIITGVIATFSRDKENAFANLKSALKNDFISKKEQWIIRKIAFRLRETFFTGKIKRLKDFPELKVEYTSFSSSVDLDALHASYEAEIQQVIDADDYNTLLRYYDNKGIFTMFLPQLKLENKMPYKEAVFTYLSEHKDVLTGLRSKYFPGIIV